MIRQATSVAIALLCFAGTALAAHSDRTTPTAAETSVFLAPGQAVDGGSDDIVLASLGETWFLAGSGSVISVTGTLSLDAGRAQDQCKDGGFMLLIDEQGQPFKNQGDCVSFFNKLQPF